MHTLARFGRSFPARAGLGLALGAALALGSVAHADDADDWSMTSDGQFGGSIYMDVWQGPNLELASTQLERIARVLRLTESQREEMMDLFASLEDQHLRAWVDFAEKTGDAQNFTNFSEDFDWQEQQRKTEAIGEEYEAEQERLINLMLDDLRLMISAEQEGRWELIERERRRMETLTKYGCFPEERYDLVSAVHTLDLDESEREAIAPMLEKYASEMDAPLRARNRQLEKVGELNEQHDETTREQWSMDWSDPESAQRKYEEIQQRVIEQQRAVVEEALTARTYCKRVADINKRYAMDIGEALPDSARRELETMIATESSATDQQPWDFKNYSRCRQKFTMVLNLEDMLGSYEAFSSSMAGGEEWGLMRIARDMEPLSAVQIDRIEDLQEEFEAEMELLEEKRPTPQVEQEDLTKYRFTLRTPGGNLTMMHNDPPEGMGMPNQYMVRGGAMMTEQDEETAEKMRAFNEERQELEQRYIDELRGLLTLRQRALTAFQ